MIIDLFAGPGGWSTGLRMLDPDTEMLGFELDNAACDTAEAAGHRRSRGDLTMVDPREYGAATGLIASPPCPGFSAAGKGHGRKDLNLIIGALPTCDIEMVKLLEFDHRSSLTLEPMRWIRLHRPEWIAMEQVPAVLPVWQAYADFLETKGYSTWAGVVNAEQFGVPQTRRRAVLLASRTRQIDAPVPTHSRYHTRSPERLDEGVLPWVSMAEALGYGGFTVRSNYGTGGDPKNRGERTSDQPAATVTSKINRNVMTHMGDVYNSHGCVRPIEAPSPTLTSSMDNGNFRWNAGTREGSVRVSVEEAGVLQSFPRDYPWRGTKTQQYQQAGNACPPLLSAHLLATVLGVDFP